MPAIAAPTLLPTLRACPGWSSHAAAGIRTGWRQLTSAVHKLQGGGGREAAHGLETHLCGRRCELAGICGSVETG